MANMLIAIVLFSFALYLIFTGAYERNWEAVTLGVTCLVYSEVIQIKDKLQ